MNQRKRTLSAALCVAAMVLVLSGCGRGGEEPTPTPTKTPDSGQAQQQPAATTPEPGGATGGQAASTPEPADGDTQDTATDNTSSDATAEETKTVAVISASILNVRSAPSTDGEIISTVNQGERYDVIGRNQDGSWLQIGTSGREIGWVAAEFATLETLDATADATTGSAQDSEPDTGAGDDAQAAAPTLAPSGGGSYLPATMTSPDFGGQAFLWWRSEIADRDLELMREAGFSWVKQSFAWETIEGAGKGQFDWSTADRVVRQVNNHQLKLLARLSSDPELQNFWAGAPPQNADNFADFAFALANRYNCTPQAVGCIQAYQIWNEPNLAREWGGNRPNPAQYAEFLSKAYAAIKRGNPNAIVVSAGMAPTGDNNNVAMPDDIFYEGMYEAMGGSSNGYFDMLGVHGAGFAAPPELDPATAAAEQRYGGYRFFAFRHVEDIRQIMVRYGDTGKRIVLLEFGWTFDPVNPDYRWHGAEAGITAEVQADYLKRSYQYAAANWGDWIALMSLLTMPNLDWLNDGNAEDEEQYWWAIMDPSPIDQKYFRNAFVVLCIYFNEVKGQSCVYDPNP